MPTSTVPPGRPHRPRLRLRPGRIGLLSCAAAVLVVPPASAAVTVTRASTLPSVFDGVLPRAGGGFDLSGYGISRDRLTFRATRWSGRGPVSSGVTRSIARPERIDEVAAAPTTSGPLVVLAVRRERKRRLLASSVDRSGRAVAAQVIATGGRSVQEPRVTAGGGAAVIVFDARDRATETASSTWMAFRARGEARFSRAVLVDLPGERGGFRYTAAIGPSGDGAIVATPIIGGAGGLPTRVRRISASGALGPWVRVEPPFSDSAEAAVTVARDGTVTVAVLAEVPSPSGSGASTALLTTTLPPRSDALTPVQVLYEERNAYSVVIDAVGLSTNATGESLVVAYARFPTPRLVFFAGRAGAVAPVGTAPVDTPDPFDPPTFIGAMHDDGAATVAWNDNGNGDRSELPVRAAQRPPGGSFGEASVIARPTTASRNARVQQQAVIPLTGGRSAVVVGDTAFDRTRTRVLFLAPPGGD